ncbi:MAG TPA: GTP-binding protein, partial [Candidatus Nanoarchaeia archaeon]|nr:GTP-binding protein [Candidatus Nanoarchaeia archaeon]
IWDGGNNDFSFIKPDLSIVLVDPHRPNHEILYYPGEYNFRTADVIVINKVNTAKKENIAIVKENIRKFNPKAKVIETASNIILENPGLLRNKAVVAIEDGPTVTHGGMPYGAGLLAAKANHCKIISPVKYAVGSIRETFRKFPHLKDVLPAMGYSPQQIKELESTINKIPCDFVIDGSPADLSRILNVNKPIVNVTYDIQEKSSLTLSNILKKFVVA